jgi:hypothetical protein
LASSLLTIVGAVLSLVFLAICICVMLWKHTKLSPENVILSLIYSLFSGFATSTFFVAMSYVFIGNIPEGETLNVSQLVFVGALAFALFPYLTLFQHLRSLTNSQKEKKSEDSSTKDDSQKESYDSLNSKLMTIYSPIHAFVVGANQAVPRELALKPLGSFVSEASVDLKRLSDIFRQHASELGNHNLQEWLSIEKEIKESRGFFLYNTRQEWLDELEAEYQKLRKELEKLR